LSKIVRSHIVQTDENEQKQLLDLVDEASSGLMRAILHHPRFKELEASWRGIYLLVRKIETDVDLKIYLLDVSKTELSDNLKSVGKLSKSDCYKWLVEDTVGTPGAEPWSLVCGNFTFSSNVDDVAALIRISKICEMANAPFISHVSPMIFGMDSFSEAKGGPDWKVDEDSVEGKLWETLRVSPESGFLGLAMPRYLARLPYGAATDPTESFSFEESKDLSEHENYVWANPSFVCAILLAQTYRKHGWEMIRNFELNISGLPTHIFEDEGETKTKPCAEILMTELICQKILDQGIIPLISYKDSDRIQIGGFQSISFPAKGLSGRWS
jgi:type VI secretion system protein ImpC